jgi:hypothetical protein
VTEADPGVACPCKNLQANPSRWVPQVNTRWPKLASGKALAGVRLLKTQGRHSAQVKCRSKDGQPSAKRATSGRFQVTPAKCYLSQWPIGIR